jgi:hypothetical protein
MSPRMSRKGIKEEFLCERYLRSIRPSHENEMRPGVSLRTRSLGGEICVEPIDWAPQLGDCQARAYDRKARLGGGLTQAEITGDKPLSSGPLLTPNHGRCELQAICSA